MNVRRSYLPGTNVAPSINCDGYITHRFRPQTGHPPPRSAPKRRGYHAVDAPREPAGAASRGACDGGAAERRSRLPTCPDGRRTCRPIRLDGALARADRLPGRGRRGAWSSRSCSVSGLRRRCGSTRHSPSTSRGRHCTRFRVSSAGTGRHRSITSFSTSGWRCSAAVISAHARCRASSGLLTLPAAWLAGYRVGSRWWDGPRSMTRSRLRTTAADASSWARRA